MSSTPETLNKSISNDDMLDEIPESSIINYQVNNNQISDSDESFKSVENFEPIKLNFIRKLAKVSGKISKDDLEELILQKVTESMVYRTKYAEIRVKLDMYEELIQRQRTRIELLEKQYTDLEVTHERILTAIRENPQAPIDPLKIVRSVSCQVYQPTAEYVSSVPDPIVIGDSPKKRRTRRKNEENMTEKERKGKKRVAEITTDTSDEDDDEDLEEISRKVTRSMKNNDKPKENENSEQRSSSKQSQDNEQQNLTKKTIESSNNESQNLKKQTRSCETQVDINNSSQTTGNLNSSRFNISKTSNYKILHTTLTSNQKNTESDKNTSENSKISSKTEKTSSKVDKTESSSSDQGKQQNKRGRKRKATTILDLFEKKARNSTENTNGTPNNHNSKKLKEKEVTNNSKFSHNSDSDNDVTLIEDDVEEAKTNSNQSSKSSNSTELDIELPKVLEKLAKASKLIEKKTKTSEVKPDNTTSKSKKTETNLVNRSSRKDNPTSKDEDNSKADSQTSKSNILSTLSNNESPKSTSSSSLEPESSIPVQKSFKVPTMKPKAAKSTRPGPKCSKLPKQLNGSEKLESGESSSQGSSSLLNVSSKLLNGPSNLENLVKNPQNLAKNLQNGSSKIQNYPPCATKVPPSPFDSSKKSSNLDQSFDSLNFSSCSNFDTLSSFKSSANLVTSTPLKAVDQGPAKAVKRTLDMNFNENVSSKVPKLPQRGPQLIHPSLKQSIPAPTIKVEKVNNGIRISWRIDNFKASDHADILSYQIYAFEEMAGNARISSDDWKLVGDVKALLLPMAVTLREFNEDQKFHFAIRAVDVHKRLGEFSEPKTWD